MEKIEEKEVQELAKDINNIFLPRCLVNQPKHVPAKGSWDEKWVCGVQFMGGEFNFVTITQDDFNFFEKNQDKEFAVLLGCRIKDGIIRPNAMRWFKKG